MQKHVRSWVGLHGQMLRAALCESTCQSPSSPLNKHLLSFSACSLSLPIYLNTYFRIVPIRAEVIISNFRIFFLIISNFRVFFFFRESFKTLSTLFQHFPTHHFCFWVTILTGRPQFASSGKGALLLYPPSPVFPSLDLSGLGLGQTIPV